MIVTNNKPFSGWGEIFGDEVVVSTGRRGSVFSRH